MQIDYFVDLKQVVQHAIEEDRGSGDVTAELIDPDTQVTGIVITREAAVMCGQPWVNEVFSQIDSSLVIEWLANDGDRVVSNQELFKVTGNARSILTGERTALNFLQTLSGTATTTRHYCDLIKHTKAQLLDTRKTLPGLRLAQKYAVKCGGGMNHRIGLYDAFLIKENHIRACGSIGEAISSAKTLHPRLKIEVEVENLEQLDEAVAASPDWVMLDNFTLDDLMAAVKKITPAIKLEASGGIDSESPLLRVAQTGVDFVSIGALTKHCRALDLSMTLTNKKVFL